MNIINRTKLHKYITNSNNLNYWFILRNHLVYRNNFISSLYYFYIYGVILIYTNYKNYKYLYVYLNKDVDKFKLKTNY